jgi:6-phosphogluconate dehydrogenase (decarboxylating)
MSIQSRREVECLSDHGSMMRGAAAPEARCWVVRSPGPQPESRPAPILPTAINERFASRGEDEFADLILPAMGLQFGGHEEKPS